MGRENEQEPGDGRHSPRNCETRRGHGPYFCLSVRRFGRVKREYYGKGPMAELAATLLAAQKIERRLARLQRQEEKARWAAALKAQQALDHLLDLLVQATLLTSGYHKHGGCWRKKRNGKRTDTTTEQTPGSPAPGSPGEACPAGG
jgi:hypothetical protein